MVVLTEMMKSGQRMVLPASGEFLVFLRRLVGGPGRVWQGGTDQREGCVDRSRLTVGSSGEALQNII